MRLSLCLAPTISIHALREEGDRLPHRPPPIIAKFLSTPSARRATRPASCARIAALFLSTPSARRATKSDSTNCRRWSFLSTPSARRATGDANLYGYSYTFLSTPSARRATLHCWDNVQAANEFLSTPSARRATDVGGGDGLRKGISIHALREEGDFGFSTISTMSSYFYPRPPRGGRP